MATLAQLRLDLATARAEQRTAKDGEATAKAIALLHIEGKNDDERKRNAAKALTDNPSYIEARDHLRTVEANIDTLEAQIAVEEDAIRLRELEARERLNEALLGRRVDNVIADRVTRFQARGSDEAPF